MAHSLPNMTEVVKDQLYLGNLSAARSAEQRVKFGITHIVSVCPDFPSTGPKHLSIPVEDTEYENLLIHLPETCHFIQHALDQGGRVLVHCVMGILRSSTIIAAFLMKTRRMTAPDAIRYLKNKRPQVHPNYGFSKQLDTFSKCNYAPSPSNPAYRSWKRRYEQDVTYFLNHMVDTVSIIPDKLLLSSDFPEDPEQGKALVLDLGVTHLVSISPAEMSSATASTAHYRHFKLNSQSPEALLLALPGICEYIYESLQNGGLVLINSSKESRACTAACAFLMFTQQCSPSHAFSVVENALPLFSPTRDFFCNLDLFQACGYQPDSNHPLVSGWLVSQQRPQRNCLKSGDLQNVAENVLSETGYGLSAFGDMLNALQTKHQPYVTVR